MEKPVTNSALDEIWDEVLGTIPDAPGLEDIDQLYPEDVLAVEVEEDAPPPMILPLPVSLEPEEIEVSTIVKKKKSRGRKITIRILMLTVLGGIIAATYCYFI